MWDAACGMTWTSTPTPHHSGHDWSCTEMDASHDESMRDAREMEMEMEQDEDEDEKWRKWRNRRTRRGNTVFCQLAVRSVQLTSLLDIVEVESLKNA
jgi:hypothetical protein